MSFPKGVIWQELRALTLDAVPIGSRVSFNNPQGLAGWRQAGFFSVPSVTASQFTVTTAPADFGSALLGDAEFFLDHAVEQQASVWALLTSSKWVSPAWTVVSFYYWSYFLVIALTRLLGTSVWFMDADTHLRFRRLGPPISRPPGAGAYRVSCGNMLSATTREVTLKKGAGRTHEELWKLWFNLCSNLATKHAAAKGTTVEDRAFVALQCSSKKLSCEWPSEIRNLVNYRPGFGYDVIRRGGVLGSFSFVNTEDSEEGEVVISRFENSAAALASGAPVERSPQGIVRLLVDFTFILHMIVSDLYEELVKRHALDRRRLVRRENFAVGRGLSLSAGIWPSR